MDLTQLKTQVMTMFMVKSSTAGSSGSTGGGNGDIFTMLYTMLMMNVIEQVFRGLPTVWLSVVQFVRSYILKQSQKVAFQIPVLNDKKEEVYSIRMKRMYGKSDENPFVEKVDSVIEYLCNINSSKHIQLDRRYILNTNEDIEVTASIRAKVHGIAYNDKGELDSIELTIYSTKLKIDQLRDWVDEIHRNYRYEKNNKLGNKKYFFNEVPLEPQKQLSMSASSKKGRGGDKDIVEEYNWSTAPKSLQFTMNEFKTSKRFMNVFGSHVGELKERLDLFVNHPDWYMHRGIPHSLGILLHGIPGAGKTSTIKAIARDTNRHIFNLSLRPYTTQKQLMNLFFNENVTVAVDGGQPQTYSIPMNQRVYVIEDIDCLTDIVYDRAKTGNPFIGKGEGISLSFLLNLLDGVLETPGRILVITSNYPDRLDKALVRPGRIDVKIEFTNASRQMILDMVNHFYTLQLDLEAIPPELGSHISPAEVLESLCTHFKSHTDAIQHLLQKCSISKSMMVSMLPSSSFVSSVTQQTESSSDQSNKEEEEGQEDQEENHSVPSDMTILSDPTSQLRKRQQARKEPPLRQYPVNFQAFSGFQTMFGSSSIDAFESVEPGVL